MTAFDLPTGSLVRLARFRSNVFAAIRRQLALDPTCKAYEGTVSVVFPSYFAGEDGGILYQPQDCFVVRLDCYVLGPARRYDWTGKTLDEALDGAELDLTQWITEIAEEEREEREMHGGDEW